ncbi:MAG: branched-chain amino acid ABC transporter permease [Solirubrobacterales bacterium]|nr:branched-chain amino acid ABC transporter permease [Solirubrobacterales bacterium]
MISLQTILNGLLLGGFYAAIALGLSLVFGVMRLVNLAYGELLVGGAFLAYAITRATGVDPLITLVAVAPMLFCIGYAIQRLLLTGLLRRGAEPPLVATFGLSVLAQTAFIALWTGNPKSLSAPYATAGVTVLGATVRSIYVIAFVIGILVVAAMQLMLTRTRFGVALRAASADPDTASTMGIDVKHIYAATFGIGAAIAAIAGVLIGVAFSFTPTSGITWLLIGFTVTVLGGAGSVFGTLVGGLMVGLIETIGGALVGGSYQELVVYAAFVLVIALRPRGILGKGATA